MGIMFLLKLIKLHRSCHRLIVLSGSFQCCFRRWKSRRKRYKSIDSVKWCCRHFGSSRKLDQNWRFQQSRCERRQKYFQLHMKLQYPARSSSDCFGFRSKCFLVYKIAFNGDRFFLVVLVLSTIWRRFKRGYLKQLLDLKPEVVENAVWKYSNYFYFDWLNWRFVVCIANDKSFSKTSC